MDPTHILQFVVACEEGGGFTAAAPVPDTQTTLRTEGDNLTELYFNIAEVVRAYCTATRTQFSPDIGIRLPRVPSVAETLRLENDTTERWRGGGNAGE